MWITFVNVIYQSPQFQLSFEGFLANLLQVLLVRASYSKDFNGWEDSELDKESFEEYRDKIRLVLGRLSHLIKQKYIIFLSNKLQEAMNIIQKDWTLFEVIYFAINAASSEIEKTENTYMPSLVSGMLNLPKHPVLCQTIATCIQSFSRWIKVHSNFLPNVVTYLLSILDSDTKKFTKRDAGEFSLHFTFPLQFCSFFSEQSP